MDASASNAFHDEFNSLTPEQQVEATNFVRALGRAHPRGTRGRAILDLVGSISPDDLKLMEQAIEEGCEQVDPNEW